MPVVLRSFRLSLLTGAQFRAQLVELFGIRNRIHKHLVELFVRLQRSPQVAQLAAKLQQFAQRTNLPGHLLGLKIFQTAEIQIDLQVARVRILAQLVLHAECQVWPHLLQYGVEVIGIHVHKSPVLESLHVARRLAGEVTHNAQYERELLYLKCISDVDVIRNLNARWTHARELFLYAFSSHLILITSIPRGRTKTRHALLSSAELCGNILSEFR